MIYQAIFRELQAAGVAYMVVGGVAINLYGILRSTADLDLMLFLEDSRNVAQFVEIVKRLGYKPRAPVPIEDFLDPAKRESWKIEKGALVFTLIRPNSFEQIDVFIQDPIDFQPAFTRRRIVKIDDLEIPVPSLEDLRTMKRKAGREQDLADLRHLDRLEQLDHE